MLTVDQQYAIASHPGAGPTGGLRLTQASVGHYMLLSRLESPLITSPLGLRPGTLAVAVWVLGRDWQKSKRSLRLWPAKFWIKYAAGRYMSDGQSFLSDMADILTFWRYHTVGLQCTESSGGESGGGIPAVFSIQYVLSQLGCSHSQIFDYPLKGAIAALTAYNAMNDPESGLIDDGMRAVMEQRRKIRQETKGVGNG